MKRIIVDAHQDIAFNTFGHGRDYRISALKHRQNEAGKGYNRATIGLPDALLGRVAVVCATIFVEPAHADSRIQDPIPQPSYQNGREAYQYGLRHIDYYQRLSDESPRIRLIREERDLDAVLATWEDDQETNDHVQGLVVLMEGADPIIEPQQFEEWYERGVRVVGLSWQRTRYAGGTRAPGPLTDLGRELLDVLASFNVLLDLSHLSEESYLEALDRYEGTVFASHSNPRRFCNTDRHLSDDMIRRLAERDGVMGLVPYNRFLSNEWRKGDPRLSVDVLLDAIDHVCQITGSVQHVGIGSDFDGGFGAESIPEPLETSGDLLELDTLLQARGYADDDIQAILSENMLRKLRAVLP